MSCQTGSLETYTCTPDLVAELISVHTYTYTYTFQVCMNLKCKQWGWSNLVDPAESPKIRLLNRDLEIFS